MMAKLTTPLSLKVTKETKKRIEALALTARVPNATMVRMLVEEALEQRERQK